MSAHQRLWTHSLIKKLLNKFRDSYQTYNYYKTHTMATRYGGIGYALVNDPDPQDIDANIQDDYHAVTNDLENIELTTRQD